MGWCHVQESIRTYARADAVFKQVTCATLGVIAMTARMRLPAVSLTLPTVIITDHHCATGWIDRYREGNPERSASSALRPYINDPRAESLTCMPWDAIEATDATSEIVPDISAPEGTIRKARNMRTSPRTADQYYLKKLGNSIMCFIMLAT